MSSIAQLFDILYVLINREDLSFGQRCGLIVQFSWFSIKNKISKPKDSVYFLGYKIFFRTFANLHTIIKEIFLFGEYRGITQTYPPHSIIDCGGNIGIATLFFKYLYPDSTIIVFEPSEENFQILKQNIEGNHLKNVKMVRAALSDREGSISFWDNPQKPGGSTSMSSVATSKGRGKFVEVEVPSLKLSSYISDRVDILKMDIEGGEGIVVEELDLSGKLQYIAQIIFEYHASPENTCNSLAKIIGILERNGFSILPFGIDLTKEGLRMITKPRFHFMIQAINTNISMEKVEKPVTPQAPPNRI